MPADTPDTAALPAPYDAGSPIVELYDDTPAYAERADVAFYVAQARATRGALLELGCGTGRVFLPSLRVSERAVGLDASAPMLARCEARLAAEPPEVRERARLVRGSLTDFDLDEKFSLVTAPFRVFQHLLHTEEQLACLELVRRHLLPRGRLVLDVFNPDPRRLRYSEEFAREVEDQPERLLADGRRVRRTARVLRFQPARQVNEVEVTAHVTHPDGRAERLTTRFPMRYYFRYELEHLLARAGFGLVALYGDFERGAFGDESPELVVVAEPRGAPPKAQGKGAASRNGNQTAAARGKAPPPAWTARGRRALAVDWSGAMEAREQKKGIWVAEVQQGQLLHLESGRDRAEVVELLLREQERDPDFVVGFDFSFSLPAWFLAERGLASAEALWALADEQGAGWLATCEWPFWGKPGQGRPNLPKHFRRTEFDVHETAGFLPKSTFQIAGAGTVGAGSIRGMPALARLRAAGFAVWPFDAPALPHRPLVVEIYPRLLTGRVTKSSFAQRKAYLAERYPALDRKAAELAASSDDAFDAAVSALVMDAAIAEFDRLTPAAGSEEAVEGAIWVPKGEARGTS